MLNLAFGIRASVKREEEHVGLVDDGRVLLLRDPPEHGGNNVVNSMAVVSLLVRV